MSPSYAIRKGNEEDNMYPYNYYRKPPMRVEAESHLTVQGNGVEEAVPDLAIIQIGAVTTNKDVEKAQAENSKIMEDITKMIENMGVDESDIKTVQYTINPKYDYSNNQQTIATYEVIHVIEVRVTDMTMVDSIISTSIELGANLQTGVTFTLQSPTEFYRTALNSAVLDAQEKAKEMADTLGININAIPKKVTENPTYSQSSFTATRSSNSVSPGTVKVMASVIAEFETL